LKRFLPHSETAWLEKARALAYGQIFHSGYVVYAVCFILMMTAGLAFDNLSVLLTLALALSLEGEGAECLRSNFSMDDGLRFPAGGLRAVLTFADMLQWWTQHIIRSTPHRVIAGRGSQSLVTFCYADFWARTQRRGNRRRLPVRQNKRVISTLRPAVAENRRN